MKCETFNTAEDVCKFTNNKKIKVISITHKEGRVVYYTLFYEVKSSPKKERKK